MLLFLFNLPNIFKTKNRQRIKGCLVARMFWKYLGMCDKKKKKKLKMGSCNFVVRCMLITRMGCSGSCLSRFKDSEFEKPVNHLMHPMQFLVIIYCILCNLASFLFHINHCLYHYLI